MSNAPTRDVTTTETIHDKDTTVTKVTRDHDELGKHTHSEVVDKVGPGGHVHSEATDVERDDGEQVHKEVTDKDGSHGEHIHQVVTNTDKGNRHVQKTVTDTDVDGKHVHEEERKTTNNTLLGDGIVKRVVTDRDEPGHHHHEEVTEIQKVIETERAPGGNSVTKHVVDDRDMTDGTHVHEETDTIEVLGTVETKHTVVTDKDIKGGHLHKEKVETLTSSSGEQHAVVDERIVTEKDGQIVIDEVHKEAIVKDEVQLR